MVVLRSIPLKYIDSHKFTDLLSTRTQNIVAQYMKSKHHYIHKGLTHNFEKMKLVLMQFMFSVTFHNRES